MTKKKETPAAPTVHTLASLGEALGDATLDEATTLLEGHDQASLVAAGSAVATPRISKDAAREYGAVYDFLGEATDAQLDHLPAFSRDQLRVAVWLAAEGQRRYDALVALKEGAAAQQSQAGLAAEALRAAIVTKRDQLHAAIVTFAAGDKVLLDAAGSAYGSVSDLAGAVTAQTKLVRAWRASGAAGVKKRVASSRLDEAWLAAADALAASYAAAETAAGATRSRPAKVTQADVDWVDGMNLALLDVVVTQFAAAHAADATIPRLTYSALLSRPRRPPAGAGGSGGAPTGGS